MAKKDTPVWAQNFEGGYSPLDKDEQEKLAEMNRPYSQPNKPFSELSDFEQREVRRHGTTKQQHDRRLGVYGHDAPRPEEASYRGVNKPIGRMHEAAREVEGQSERMEAKSRAAEYSNGGGSVTSEQQPYIAPEPASSDSGSSSSTGSVWDMVKTPGSSFNPYEATNSFNPYA